MTTPKPSAPKKALTYTPPQHFPPIKVSELPEVNDDMVQEFIAERSQKEEKKPFVLKPHLTQRPFQDGRLAALKEDLRKEHIDKTYRKPRPQSRQSR
jgi:hypothetical protein